jgi:hypothetical protein
LDTSEIRNDSKYWINESISVCCVLWSTIIVQDTWIFLDILRAV